MKKERLPLGLEELQLRGVFIASEVETWIALTPLMTLVKPTLGIQGMPHTLKSFKTYHMVVPSTNRYMVYTLEYLSRSYWQTTMFVPPRNEDDDSMCEDYDDLERNSDISDFDEIWAL